MTHTGIHVGHILRLKPLRRDAYGMSCDTVLVTGIKQREGYTVPFIQSGGDFYKPSDFDKIVGYDSTLQLTQTGVDDGRY